MTRNVVILNDTSFRYHHGCARVMRLLRDGLTTRGATILATSPARNNWQEDAAFLAALARADTVVINGEGTLHHGADAGARLLGIAEHPAANGKKLCLVNALYDQNPPEWAAFLKRFDLVAARDSDSACQMEQAIGAKVNWLPDLSLSAPATNTPGPRDGIILGDSVRLSHRQALARAADRFDNVTFMPTKTLRQGIWRLPILGPVLKTALYAAYNGHGSLRRPRFEMPLTEADYLEAITRAELHITGRFHAVCLSLLTATPFIAVTSTSGKIEKLLTDLGLGTDRIVSDDALQAINPNPHAHMFSAVEREAIASALDDAQTRAAVLFDEVLA